MHRPLSTIRKMKITLKDQRNMIQLNQTYFEKIRLKNIMGLFAYYDLTIKPNETNVISFSSDDKTIEEWLQHIKGKLINFFEDLNSHEIGVTGMDLEITNNKFHAVDSKPVAIQVTIIQSLTKILNSANSTKVVKKSLLQTSLYSIKELTEYQRREPTEYELVTIELQGLRFEDYVLLNHSHEINLSESSVSTLVRPKHDISYSTTRRMHFNFKNDLFSLTYKIKFYEIIKNIENDFAKIEKDLGEFEVFVDFSSYDKFNENPNFFLDWEWSLRNLLNNQKSIKRVEKSR